MTGALHWIFPHQSSSWLWAVVFSPSHVLLPFPFCLLLSSFSLSLVWFHSLSLLIYFANTRQPQIIVFASHWYTFNKLPLCSQRSPNDTKMWQMSFRFEHEQQKEDGGETTGGGGGLNFMSLCVFGESGETEGQGEWERLSGYSNGTERLFPEQRGSIPVCLHTHPPPVSSVEGREGKCV